MRRTPRLAVLAATAALGLTGCAGLRPGVAAEVGDETISLERVDAFAEGLCVYGQSAPTAPASEAETRRVALGLLLRAMLAERFAGSHRHDVPQAEVDRQIRESVAPAVADLPDDERERFLEEVRFSLVGDQLASQAVLEEVQSTGSEPSQEAVQEATTELYAQWTDEADVEVDPRFGTWSDVDVQAASGSLSVAASEETPDSSLPGARSCG